VPVGVPKLANWMLPIICPAGQESETVLFCGALPQIVPGGGPDASDDASWPASDPPASEDASWPASEDASWAASDDASCPASDAPPSDAVPHVTWMSSVLLVPEQGLPKTVVVAGTLHDAFPRQSVETTDTEVVALQEPVLKLPQVPVGVPKLANWMAVTT
jgi:hypothetical protein